MYYPGGGENQYDSWLRLLTFCFLRLQESHAWAVRRRWSSGTFGRAMLGRQAPEQPWDALNQPSMGPEAEQTA